MKNANVNETTTSAVGGFNMKKHTIERLAVLEAAILGAHTLTAELLHTLDVPGAGAHPGLEAATRLDLALRGALRLTDDIACEVDNNAPMCM